MVELDYPDISYEYKGALTHGKLKLTSNSLMYKPNKSNVKAFTLSPNEIDLINWQRFTGSFGIRIFTSNGSLFRFGGFKDTDKDKVGKFFSKEFNKNMSDLDVCYKGWNWGTAKFKGSVLSFDVSNTLGFEVPLSYVSQCTTGKNEVTLEFHPNDDAPVSLCEMRFHMPSSENAGDTEPVDAFKDQVMKQADIISATGDAIAIFREVQCLTPRGRYDIKVFQSFFQLHGKTFDYKIPMSTVLRLFLLPHKDGRQMFFVVSLDPPIKQGQTRYHYVIFLFGQEEDCTIELPLSDEELASKYEGKLEKEINGPTYEVVSGLMKIIANRKITGPGQFIGHSQTPAVGCSYKAAAGYIYPLERGFMYIHKPPIHIRFDEIVGVNFARGGGNTRSFDFEVELKSGVVHTFSSIEKEEYHKLYEFITSKKLRVKSTGGKMDKGYIGNLDNETSAPDAYLARVKAEAEERSDDGLSDGDSSEEDEDYNPEKSGAAGGDSDVAEEFDSDAGSSSEDEDEEEGSDDSAKKKKKHDKKEKRKSSGGEEKKKKATKEKDSAKPSSSRKKKEPAGSSSTSGKKPVSIKKEKDKESPKKPSGDFKSKEFIDTDDDSSSGGD